MIYRGTETAMVRQEWTREEKNRLEERLMPGEKILWQGKSRAKWLGKIRKNWKGILFLLFFAAAFGRGFYVVATAPVRGGGEGSIPVLAVAGICCLMALLTILVILMGSFQETCRQQATLHALTDKRLLSLGPSADGLGVSFQQFDGAVVKDVRQAQQGAAGTPVLFFPCGGSWLRLASAVPIPHGSLAYHRQPGK